jgi:hypothetical protein
MTLPVTADYLLALVPQRKVNRSMQVQVQVL